MRKTYSPEFKAKVAREVLREDKTLSQVAAAHERHPNLVSQWRDQALAGMAGLFSRAKETDWAAKEAAHALSRRILDGTPGAAEDYVKFLSAGGSAYPVDILKRAGVDMSTGQRWRRPSASSAHT